MPNWIKGTLKLRGKTENIISFLQNGVHCYLYTNDGYVPVDREKWCQEYHDENYHEFIIKDLAHIDGTNRAFIEEQEISFETGCIAVIDFRQAWEYDADQFVDIAKKYNLDIRAYGIESGMQFIQEFEIINNKTTMKKQIKYVDWDWECPFPRMGG